MPQSVLLFGDMEIATLPQGIDGHSSRIFIAFRLELKWLQTWLEEKDLWIFKSNSRFYP